MKHTFHATLLAALMMGTAAQAVPGTLITDEFENFTVPANTTVAYGEGSKYVTKTVSGAAACTNDYFGRDPSAGVRKACYNLNTSSSVEIKIADEDQNFSVPAATAEVAGASRGAVPAAPASLLAPGARAVTGEERGPHQCGEGQHEADDDDD